MQSQFESLQLLLLLLSLATPPAACLLPVNVSFNTGVVLARLDTPFGRVQLKAFATQETTRLIGQLRHDRSIASRMTWMTAGYPVVLPNENRTIARFESGTAVVQLELLSGKVLRSLAAAASRQFNVRISTKQIHLMTPTEITCYLGTRGNIRASVRGLNQSETVSQFELKFNSAIFKENVDSIGEQLPAVRCSLTFSSGNRTFNRATTEDKLRDTNWTFRGVKEESSLEERTAEIKRDIDRLKERLKTLQLSCQQQPQPPIGDGEFDRIVKVNGIDYLIVQHRVNGRLNFNRNWTQYERGFASDNETWIGLHRLSSLTRNSPRQLRIELLTFSGQSYQAVYDNFRVRGPETAYTMMYTRMNSRLSTVKTDALQHHKFARFSTFDSDNDSSDERNCAEKIGGGWWFTSCFAANLNGKFYQHQTSMNEDAILWFGVGDGHDDLNNFKEARMLIRL